MTYRFIFHTGAGVSVTVDSIQDVETLRTIAQDAGSGYTVKIPCEKEITDDQIDHLYNEWMREG